MEAYRLYAVVPALVNFIEQLTNIYVRYNRKRLKGARGQEDCEMALATLFDTLLKVCIVLLVLGMCTRVICPSFYSMSELLSHVPASIPVIIQHVYSNLALLEHCH
jgi:isoleucyl-tRNA synthetase